MTQDIGRPGPDPAGPDPAGPPPARVALITGPGRGIGRAIALSLAGSGYAVGLLGRSRAALDEVAGELRATGAEVAVALGDVRSYADVVAAVAAVQEQLGGIDLLVNNAGVVDPVELPAWEADPLDWWEVLNTDLRGPFHCIRAVVPGMLARGGGRVVDVNSGAGAEDRPVYSAYSAAKTGLLRLGGSLHLAGFARGLRVFEISPGHIRTDMTASMPMHAGRTEWTALPALLELVLAAGSGRLDAWSGCFLRAGVDTPDRLAALAAAGGPEAEARRLGVSRYGPDDPLI